VSDWVAKGKENFLQTKERKVFVEVFPKFSGEHEVLVKSYASNLPSGHRRLVWGLSKGKLFLRCKSFPICVIIYMIKIILK
jgi:hypothetical protein